MIVQPRVFGKQLTPEQQKEEDRYFAAVQVLRGAGFAYAEVDKLVVFDPQDRVAVIRLERR